MYIIYSVVFGKQINCQFFCWIDPGRSPSPQSRAAHTPTSHDPRGYTYMDGCIYYIYILSTICPGGGNPRGDIYIYMYDQIKRAREIFSSVGQRSRHKRQLFYMYNHPVVRAVCIGLLCVSRMFNVYKVPTVAMDQMFAGSRGRGWQNRVRGNITFSVFDKTRNNIVFNTRKYKPPPSSGTVYLLYGVVYTNKGRGGGLEFIILRWFSNFTNWFYYACHKHS